MMIQTQDASVTSYRAKNGGGVKNIQETECLEPPFILDEFAKQEDQRSGVCICI